MARPTIHRFWRETALPFVESRRANDSSACYAPHAHDALSIGAVDGGSSVLCRDGRRRRLTRGDVVLIAAGEVHSCNPEDDGRWSYQMLYLDSDWVRGVVDEPGESSVSSASTGYGAPVIERLPESAAARQLHGRLTRLNALLFGDASPADKEAALVLFVGDLYGLAPSTASRRAAASESTHLRRVQELIEHNCEQALRLDELAGAAQMSRYQLLRAFRRAFGMTPHAWQVDLRIQRARRLLDQGMSLADAALQLGFADQSHFQRAFKERVAATPGEYRRGRAGPS